MKNLPKSLASHYSFDLKTQVYWGSVLSFFFFSFSSVTVGVLEMGLLYKLNASFVKFRPLESRNNYYKGTSLGLFR